MILRERLNEVIGEKTEENPLKVFLRDLVDVSIGKKILRLYKKKVLKVLEFRKLDSLLGLFMKKKIHMAVVFNSKNCFVGVVSLEDVVEEIFGKEIVDEDDFFEDVEKGKRFNVLLLLLLFLRLF